MNFKKAFLVGVAAGLMAGIGSTAQAVTVIFQSVAAPGPGGPGSINWAATGVTSDPDPTGRFLNDLTNPGNNTFPNQSQIVYFQNTTFDLGLGNTTETFSSTGVYFDYQVSVNGSAFKYFRVVGNTSGTMTFDTVSGANSLAKWTPISFYTGADIATLAPIGAVLTVDPVTGAPSDKISLSIGGALTDIFIYTQNPLTAPFEPGFAPPSNASINGFIRAAVVPEPSAVAMLLASGVAGTAFLIRRRRA